MRFALHNSSWDVPLDLRVLPPSLEEVQIMADKCQDLGITVYTSWATKTHQVVTPPTWRLASNSRDVLKPHVYAPTHRVLMEIDDVDYEDLQIAIHEWIVGWSQIFPEAYSHMNQNTSSELIRLSTWFQLHRRRYILGESMTKAEMHLISDTYSMHETIYNCIYRPKELFTNLAHRIDTIAPWRLQ